MILNVKCKDFLAAAKKVSKATDYNPALQILGCIHVEADDRQGVIKVTATNLQVSIRAIVPASIEANGSAVLDSRLLISILEKLSNEDVYLELKGGYMLIQSGETRFEIPVHPCEEYPTVVIPVPGETVSITGIKSLVGKTAFCASRSSNDRPELGSMILTLSESGATASTTNGFGIMQTIGDSDCKGNISLLIPVKAMQMLASITSDSDIFEMGITGEGGKSVVFSDGVLTFSSRLVNGSILDVNRIFGGLKAASTVKVKAEDLYAKLSGFKAMISDDKRLGLFLTKDGIRFVYKSEGNAGVVLVNAEVSDPTPTVRYFSADYLSSCAGVMSGDIVLCLLKDGNLSISDRTSRYMQIAMRAPVERTDENKKKTVKKKQEAA